MPFKKCIENWKPWYKRGDNGKCYTYTPWKEKERKKAKQKAIIQWYTIEKDKLKKELQKTTGEEIKIVKTMWFNTVLFAVLVPNEVDRNWDIITEDEIVKTAYQFMKNLEQKAVNVDHQRWTIIPQTYFVESYIAPLDIPVWEWKTIPKWSWIVGIQFDEKIYNEIVNWNYVGVSMEWLWRRTRVDWTLYLDDYLNTNE